MSEGKGIVSFVSMGPRLGAYAAAVSFLSRNAFIVFGGDQRSASGNLDNILYWLDTSMFFLALNHI